jgi:hypothetical protein
VLLLLRLLIPSGKLGGVLLLVEPFPAFGFGVERVDDPRRGARLRHFDVTGPFVFPNDDSVSGFLHDLHMVSRLGIATSRSRINLFRLAEATEGREDARDCGRGCRAAGGDFPIAERGNGGAGRRSVAPCRSSSLRPRDQVKVWTWSARGTVKRRTDWGTGVIPVKACRDLWGNQQTITETVILHNLLKSERI